MALWVLAVGLGQVAFSRYNNTPAKSLAPAWSWPRGSGLNRSRSGPTLVMAAHPQCPCTRATLTELEHILATSPGHLEVRILFVLPPGYAPSWAYSDTWRQARALPGVTCSLDRGGAEARRFHLATSGQTEIFDQHGNLVFSGGLTVSRGEVGDNPAEASVESLLRTGKTTIASSPVFGCALFSSTIQ